jgi:hypothetical protein
MARFLFLNFREWQACGLESLLLELLRHDHARRL